MASTPPQFGGASKRRKTPHPPGRPCAAAIGSACPADVLRKPGTKKGAVDRLRVSGGRSPARPSCHRQPDARPRGARHCRNHSAEQVPGVVARSVTWQGDTVLFAEVGMAVNDQKTRTSEGGLLDRYFRLSEHGTTVGRELLA